MDRRIIAIKGSIVGIIYQIVNLVFKLTVRTLVIRLLGKEILGLDGVLVDTVSMLSLAELGVTSAMTFRLYTPIIEQNTERISYLMASYKVIYRAIALVVAVIGFVISFFLPLIINDISIPWGLIYSAYFLQVINTVSSYLLSYKRILLNADQRMYYCMIADMVSTIIFSIFKIVCLLLFKSYLLYLCGTIMQTVLSNAYLHIYAKKIYSQIVKKKSLREDINDIMKDTKDVLGGKLAGFVYSSTDNIIISIFIGTGVVGLLSNYKFISTSLKSVLTSLMSTMQPLIGNYLNSHTSIEDSFRTLKRYIFVRYLFVGYTSIAFIVSADSFVAAWTGKPEYVMNASICVLLAIEYYIGGIYGPLGEYLIGMGMFKYSKYPQIAGAFCNIIFSILGATLFGVEGVLIATVISQVVIFTGYFYYLFKKYFDQNKKVKKKDFAFTQLRYMFNTVFIILATRIILMQIKNTRYFMKFAVGIAVSFVLFAVSVIVLFRNIDEYKYFRNLIMIRRTSQ